MLVLISPAKTMRSGGKSEFHCTEPRFAAHSRDIVSQMLQYSIGELSDIFRVSGAIARLLRGRFVDFVGSTPATLTAVECYDGVVYKHLKGEQGLFEEDMDYLHEYLRISSLLYGLLRAKDAIKPYRMEGFVRLSHSDERVDRYWRDIQTRQLIEDTQERGGVLIYLAAKEEQRAFHWAEVKREVQLIEIKFLQHRGGKLRQVVIYTKMARGEMVRYMVDHRISNHEELKDFEWGGYTYNDSLSTQNEWVWVNGEQG